MANKVGGNEVYSVTVAPITGEHHRNPLTAAISKDSGETWGNLRNIEDRKGYSSAYPNVFINGNEALVTYYHCSESTHGVSSLELKIFPIEWFYGE